MTAVEERATEPWRGLRRGFTLRNLSLSWKLLLPFLALLVALGGVAMLLVVLPLGTGARTEIERDLKAAHDEAFFRHIYFLRRLQAVARSATKLEGVHAALKRGDAAFARSRLDAVATNGDLSIVALTDRRGRHLVDLRRPEPTGRYGYATFERAPEVRARDTGLPSDLGPALSRLDQLRVDAERRGPNAAARVQLDETFRRGAAMFIRGSDGGRLVIASPACGNAARCDFAGAVVFGVWVSRLEYEAELVIPWRGAFRAGGHVQFLDSAGGTFDGAFRTGATANSWSGRTGSGMRAEKRRVTYVGPVNHGAKLAVSVAPGPADRVLRGTALRLGVTLLMAMQAVVVLGLMLSAHVRRQLSPLLAASRALGRGEFDARAPVLSRDEIGDLARGMNHMAGELQASYETLETRVAERTEEVRRLLTERSNFFAMLSHELRTPLAVIINQADLIEADAREEGSPAATDAARAIGVTGDHLLHVVNDILEVAKAEAGRLELDLTAVSVGALINDVLETVVALARSRGIEVSTSVPKRLPLVRADARRLHEVLLNLADNAVKYTPSGGRVELAAKAVNGAVELSVRDTGVGIPVEVGDDLFEPFYRVAGVMTQHGEPSSGLGLALSQRLVVAQGGTLRYSSSAVGTVFTVSLPKAAARAQTPRSGEPNAGASARTK